MADRYRAEIEPRDDDGWSSVTIIDTQGEDVVLDRYTILGIHSRQWAEQELAILNDEDAGKTCPHGLALSLCVGPSHYPLG